jgi:hypothetical protein
VETDSSELDDAGDIAAIMIVFELPPSESCSSRVRIESRYGTNTFFPFAWSASAEITFPSAGRGKGR